MKKFLIFLALAPFYLWAEDRLKYTPPIQLTHSAVDPNLEGTEAIYEFQFASTDEALPESEVHYSIDGSNFQQLTKDRMITIPSTAGKHIFQFYYNTNYAEVFSDSILIEAGFRDRYQVNLDFSELDIVFKPVIYLYPQLETEVHVKIDIHGEDPFLYPAYIDGWNFTAEPNGDLIFGEESFNYLFWEATQRNPLSAEQTASGFFVEGKEAVQFLEDKLTQAGFTSKEQADFITFWVPRLAQNKLNFVHFEFNETCQKYADLYISPKPDHLYRIFMLWGAVQAEFPVAEQEIERIDRSGFSVLEWGGQEKYIRQNVEQKTNEQRL